MGARQVYHTQFSISGMEGSRIAYSSNAALAADVFVATTMRREYQPVYTSVAGSGYDPDFVASILHADAAPPEATFTNVVDMLEWLNRD
jgi:hypothetical protein